jgi:hypothetical protein
MAGTRMSSNSQHHHSHSSNNGTNNLSVTTGGRERAIEALIDREPQGDYYRAARVLVRSIFRNFRLCIISLLLVACFTCSNRIETISPRFLLH